MLSLPVRFRSNNSPRQVWRVKTDFNQYYYHTLKENTILSERSWGPPMMMNYPISLPCLLPSRGSNMLDPAGPSRSLHSASALPVIWHLWPNRFTLRVNSWATCSGKGDRGRGRGQWEGRLRARVALRKWLLTSWENRRGWGVLDRPKLCLSSICVSGGGGGLLPL